MSNGNLSRTLTLTIGKNEYEVKYPNTGQQMDIDLLRLQISDGKYDQLKFSFNPRFQRQALRVDTIATFNTLIPKLKKDLCVKTIFELEDEQMNELVKVYEEEYLPWSEEWDSILNDPKAEEEEKEKKDGQEQGE